MNVTLKLEEHSNRGSSITEDIKDFIDCVNQVEVEDIGSSGSFYTWTKILKNPNNSILKKLDRIMVSEQFLTSLKMPKSFRFANYTVDKPEFINEVTNRWKYQVEGHKMFCITKKLNQLKSLLNKLNWKHEDLTFRAEQLRIKLQEVQSQVEKDPYNKHVKSKAVLILDEYNEAVQDEEKLLA
ncbi:hypothetical protein Tco_0092611 [Tanacetum coccineum]